MIHYAVMFHLKVLAHHLDSTSELKRGGAEAPLTAKKTLISAKMAVL